MKIEVSNLGALKWAEFTLGDLTIICGGNNTGKTYATYALYGFLDLWKRMLPVVISDEKISQLLTDGVTSIDLTQYMEQAGVILERGGEQYSQQLSAVFATSADKFKDAGFKVIVDVSRPETVKFERRISSASNDQFYIRKEADSMELVISLLTTDRSGIQLPREAIKQFIGDAIKDILFGEYFPKPFIASAERTGAAIFRKELNFARNRLLEEMSKKGKEIDPFELLFKSYEDYALPVKNNVDFTRQLESLAKKSSVLKTTHPDIMKDFADIIGGEYTVSKDDELYYIPNGKKIRLTMDESSSAVRSLLDIGFYLKHLAKPGDLLMIDEPELNLHPENQRRVARLLSRLVNAGIKVFITTHSDYIIRELNTLIMLNHDKPHLKMIMREEGYKEEELLGAERVKVYIAEETLVKLDGNQRKTRCHTFVAADIDPNMGIEARTFDSTIDTMNRIQDSIVWGGE